MLEGPILAKDLAVEYKYLANTSEWFYIARKNAERVIRNMTSLTKGKNRTTKKKNFLVSPLFFLPSTCRSASYFALPSSFYFQHLSS